MVKNDNFLGGFSIVRLAQNLNNNKYYAIKIMSKSE
jgi:serine/threonine protein kinase